MSFGIKNKVIIFDEIDSTQKKAKSYILDKKAENGLVIIAKKQFSGIGRLNRSWISPNGGIWMSSIYEIDPSKIDLSGLSVKLGLLFCKVFRNKYNRNFQVKWPNDIYLSEKKIAGILIEIISVHPEKTYLIIGLGLNLNFSIESLSKEIADSATTMQEEFHHKFFAKNVLELIIKTKNYLIENISEKNNLNYFDDWINFSYTYKKEISAKLNDEEVIGIESGITKNGSLRIKVEDGSEKLIQIGDIRLLRIK